MSLTDDIRPHLASDGVPMCDDACPSYDGKRCRVLGLRPGNICEPAVAEMVAALSLAKSEAEALRVDLQCERIRSEDRGVSYQEAIRDRDEAREHHARVVKERALANQRLLTAEQERDSLRAQLAEVTAQRDALDVAEEVERIRAERAEERVVSGSAVERAIEVLARGADAGWYTCSEACGGKVAVDSDGTCAHCGADAEGHLQYDGASIGQAFTAALADLGIKTEGDDADREVERLRADRGEGRVVTRAELSVMTSRMITAVDDGLPVTELRRLLAGLGIKVEE